MCLGQQGLGHSYETPLLLRHMLQLDTATCNPPSLCLSLPQTHNHVKSVVVMASGETPRSSGGFASAEERTEGSQEMDWHCLSQCDLILSFPFPLQQSLMKVDSHRLAALQSQGDLGKSSLL